MAPALNPRASASDTEGRGCHPGQPHLSPLWDRHRCRCPLLRASRRHADHGLGHGASAPADPAVSAGRWRAAVLALALAGCGFDVAGEQAMAAPDVYRTWWSKTEACSGLTGDFDRVEWEVVPGPSFTCSSGQCAGHWESSHRIWIADEYVNNEMVVRHEMLHDLLGHSGHPNPPFGEGCPLTWATWTGSTD
jgi:hypothetical protein